ncbi:uncharacterized protein LOC136069391 [Quercus suber]|uniref:uncharacterized protein LOC136069391 n=1 Tax=Quercus suber TaxID=58331 RepID=UPI0032DEC6BF
MLSLIRGRKMLGDLLVSMESQLRIRGCSNRSQFQTQLFQDVIDKCGFIDLGFVGTPYTWQKHFVDGHSIWEKLDRGLATNDWLMKFLGVRIQHLSSNSSNHSPLWIIPDGLEVASVPKLFRFEEMWLLDPGCSNVVEVVWSSDVNAYLSSKVVRKIEKCGKKL